MATEYGEELSDPEMIELGTGLDRGNHRACCRRIDGPTSWAVLFCGLLSTLIVYGCSATYGILFPAIFEAFKAGRALTAFPGALATANSGLLGPVVGRLCDRFGCRVVMICGGLTCAVGLLLSSFAPNIVVLYVTFGLVHGFGTCFVYVASMVIVPDYFDKQRFMATAIVSTGSGAGMFVMSLIVQGLLTNVGWRNSFKAMAAICLIPFILGWAVRSRRGKSARQSNQSPELALRDQRKRCSLEMCKIDFSVLRNPLFVLYTTMNVVTSLGHVMPTVHLAKYCEDIGIPSDRSSWLYFIIGLTSLVSRLLVGRLFSTGWVTLPHVFQVGSLLLAAANLLLSLATEYKFIVSYSVVYGIGSAMTITSTVCLIMDSLPAGLTGQGFGIYQFFLAIPYGLGPLLSGFIADLSGSYNPAFYTAGSLNLIGGCLPFLARLFPTSDREDNRLCLSTGSTLDVAERETVV